MSTVPRLHYKIKNLFLNKQKNIVIARLRISRGNLHYCF